MITIPFDLELAKKINNGERNGMIVTDGDNYRVEFVYHREESFPILGVIHTDHGIISDWFSNNGFGGKNYRLKLKVPEYTTFKDGDVLSNEQGDVYEILDNGTNDVVYHSNIEDGYIAFWKQELKMIENMEDKDISDKTRMKLLNQGIWLAVQELAYDGRWTQAAEELVSSCGLTEDECRKLQEESGSFDDEMLEFIDTIFGRKIDLDEDNQMIDIDISTMKVGDTYSFMNNQKEMVEIKAVKRSMLGCNGCYLSNSEILCKGCNKSERETNDNIMVVRIDKMDDVYRNDRPLDSGIGVVHSFRINNKIIKAVACQTVIRNDICSKCCFVDTNICSNMRCFSSVREDNKSVIFKKIEL